MKTKDTEKIMSVPKETVDGNYIKISVPSIKTFSSSRYTPFYVFLLLIMAFLLGMLTTKISVLQQNKTLGTATAQAQTIPQQAQVQQQAPAAPQKVANVV